MRVIVVGAGTGGATFAGRLAQDGRHEVVLVEAGPDFGPFDGMGWPFELLDSRRIPTTHDWHLVNQDPGTERTYSLMRARVMGGCSSHNGCAAVRGLRGDYARWSEVGGADFWNPDDMMQDFKAIDVGLNVRTYAIEEVSPFQQDFYHAARAAGVAHSDDMNDIDEGPAVTMCPVNKRGGVRWNAAFGFVDPVRGRSNFSIVDNCEITGILLDGSKVRGVRGQRLGKTVELAADMVVLAAGAYHSPMLLMRSGIGDPDILSGVDVAVRHALPGVGRNLQDHPSVVVEYAAAPEVVDRMVASERLGLVHDECTIVKARSPWSRDLFDMHIFSVGGRTPDLANWYWWLYVSLLSPTSRGQIRPVRKDGDLDFVIEHRHVTDPGNADLKALRWGVAEARRMAGFAPFAGNMTEIKPGKDATDAELDAWVRNEHLHYYHPASSCSIGRDPKQGAVVDVYGRVHGLDGLMIADASIMPYVTIANTNLPAAAIGHRLARKFDEVVKAAKV
ncbi:MAG: GMC family oxidoreductase [Geminicoccaceae bacterium]